MKLASNDLETVNNALHSLIDKGAEPNDVEKMSMYFGFLGALKRRAETEFGIIFEGRDGVIAKANQRYQEVYENRDYRQLD